MQYTINQHNYRDFDLLQIGKLDARAYFIPYKDEKKLLSAELLKERYESDMVEVLSGAWEFKYYKKQSLMPKEYDTASVQFDEITVPSTWQRTGYQAPVYLNQRYEFHLMPPELPEEMSAGVYRKVFRKPAHGKNFILSFLGVAPCLDVYLNGKHIGYSEGSHNTAEFNITKHLVEGENELLCVVHRWSVGTYLECQDMFRETGIFRDVLLYCLDGTYLNDFEVKTKKQGDSRYALTVNNFLKGDLQNCRMTLRLADNKSVILEKSLDASEETVFSFENLEVTEWNAEIPTVYTLLLTLEKDGEALSSVRQMIGFKTIRIDGEVFKFNEMPIKMKGVNHHDSHHKTGYVMSHEDIFNDIRLMKAYNVNTVRTSHYPPDPIFLTLCDIYGLYVVDEADIEAHGCNSIGPLKLYKPNLISHDPKWAPRYVDRVSRMYKRDRNHPCVTMWSLGNEAGGYCNQDACCDYLKSVCPEIPVHYEGAIRTSRVAYDVISEMYTSIPDLEKYRDGTRGDKYKGKPFYLCEYAHAMGVGPGSLEDYWQTLYSSDKFMGGCIWEFCDHAVYHDKSEKGYKYEYTYGGDHKEPMHDSNFCVDGLFYPDRTPHTGALEMKEVYRPIRGKKLNPTTYSFTNTNRFKNAKYLAIKWSLLENAKEIKEGEFTLDLAPMATTKVEIPVEIRDKKKDYLLNLTYVGQKTGRTVAREQFVLTDNAPVVPIQIEKQKKLVVMQEEKALKIKGGDCKITFSMENGNLLSYICHGKELLNTEPIDGFIGFAPNIYRVPIDNDAYGQGQWNRKKIAKIKPVFMNMHFEEEENRVLIQVKYKFTQGLLFPWYFCTVHYEVYPDATIKVSLSLDKKWKGPKHLPRFGVTLELPKTFKHVLYYGRGEAENLPDFNAQAPIGLYSAKVSDMHENYVKPQDNGNHGDVKYLRLTDGNGDGIQFIGADKFSFSVHNYSQGLLHEAKHREDLYVQNTTFLSLDGYMRGSGSNACGPDVLDKYLTSFQKEVSFAFSVQPVLGEDKQ